MDFSVSTLMMVFFVLLLIISIWKIYDFLPNEQLEDDDTTPEATQDLIHLMFSVIKENQGELTKDELFSKMQEHEEFDSERFWRFNLNRLNQLLQKFYIENPDARDILDIYKKISS
jgi:cytoskeletal protein RodZ